MKVLKITGRILAVLLVIIASVFAASIIILSGHARNIERLDENGRLYYMEYAGNYERVFFTAPLSLLKKGSCSAFVTSAPDGDVLTCRNYDVPHTDKNGDVTGLNVVLRLNLEGNYESVNFADAAWFSVIGLSYYSGALDDGKTTQLPLAFLPYFCMDGINEKGLTASILYLDTKEGESAVYQKDPEKEEINITRLLRIVLDKCATVQEAIDMAEKYNMVNTAGGDYHLFVTDKEGTGAVLEWRNNELIPVYTDAVTNFYVCSDDAQDCYSKGVLKEKFEGIPETTRSYRFGYGHGYDRFTTIVYALDEHIVDSKTFKTEMTYDEALETLSSAAQDFDGTSLTSYTQYSVMYNNSKLSADIFVAQDFDTKYSFAIG